MVLAREPCFTPRPRYLVSSAGLYVAREEWEDEPRDTVCHIIARVASEDGVASWKNCSIISKVSNS